jgi:hypothetical protein
VAVEYFIPAVPYYLERPNFIKQNGVWMHAGCPDTE